MRRYRLWHRLLGHGKTTTPEFKPEDYMPERMVYAALMVRDVCSCGDQWVFSGMAFTEFYVPSEGVIR